MEPADVADPGSSLRPRYSLYSAPVPAALRRVRRQAVLPIACGVLAALLVVALLTFVPLSGDAPSHLFQTWLYRHGGFQLWNNLWYAGRYEFVSYSVFYYPLAAQTGELPVLAVAAAALAVCFAALSRREWGSAARGPAVAFACTTTFVLIVSGSYPFTAGAACAAAALLALQRRSRILFGVAVIGTLGFSPLAFAVLLALLAGLLLGHPQPLNAARRHWTALAIVVVAMFAGVLLQRAFPSGGIYPYNVTDALVVVLFSLAGLYVTGKSPRARSLRMLFIAYLILNLIAFLFKSPVGSNATRLFAVAGAPLLWLAANVSRQRSQVIVFPLLAATAALQVGPWIRDAYSAWGNPAASATYWRPGHRLPAHAGRRPAPCRSRRDLGPLGGVLPGPGRLPARPGMVPPGRLPREPGALRPPPDGREVRPLAAGARRALRRAARHDPRLQLGGRGPAAALGRLGPRARVELGPPPGLQAARRRAHRVGAAG